MSINLFCNAIIKFIIGIILVGLLIFTPAGSFKFYNGWLFMLILFLPMFVSGIVMMFKNPSLLNKRINAKEKLKDQDIVIKLSGIMFISGFIISGLGFRFCWYTLPKGIILSACIIFLIAYILYALVLKENTYLSRTIEVEKEQKVIDTGLYGIVRHPMYTATLFLFLSMPLILGSIYSFIIFLAYPFIIIKRIKSEEIFLEKNLNGYKEYKLKVKYRLIPFIW